jgi:hypothetical protein
MHLSLGLRAKLKTGELRYIFVSLSVEDGNH